MPALLLAFPLLAAAPSPLVVGNVRDASGAAIAGASVRAFDASGGLIDVDASAADGTFALHLSRPASTIEVRCRYCATTRVSPGDGNVAVVVRRYVALANDVPNASDFAALPYARTVDALALVPFSVANGNTISDRGLGGGRGLVFDDGSPVVDLATGGSGLADFPDRYVRSVSILPPSQAFAYGPNAGGGIFSLDQFATPSSATLASGYQSSVALLPAIGIAHPAAGVSSDDDRIVRRADLDFDAPFLGGQLRAGADEDATTAELGPSYFSRDQSEVRVAYGTASREARTFVDFSGDRVSYGGPFDYGASYSTAGIRVEHPGTIALDFGARLTSETANYVVYGGGTAYAFGDRYQDATAYASAAASAGLLHVDAGLGITDDSTSKFAALPSVQLTQGLGGGFYARASFSESLRTPNILEGTTQLERGELGETALGFDDGGRMRAEAMGYREDRDGSLGVDRLQGFGGTFVWQIAPTIAVRAWDLEAGNDTRRSLWATYASGPRGLRVDALLRDDAGTALDGSLSLPLFDGYVSAGTAREKGVRRFQTSFTISR